MRTILVASLLPAASALVVGTLPTSHTARATTALMSMPWEQGFWEPAPKAEEPTAEAGEVEEKAEEEKKGIDFSGLAQLMTMGAGAPMLGDLKKINLNKPEAEGGAALQFELEANNFEDENGNLKSGEYRDEGWVDEDAPDPMAALNDFGKGLGKLFGGK